MLENMPKLDTSNLPDEILEHSEKLAGEMLAVGKIQDGSMLGVLVGYAKQQRAEVERLRMLVREAYLEGYGQTGAWTRRESSWIDSEAKTKL